MTPEQCKMARAGVGIGVRDLAAAAQVSTNTITRFEAGEELKARTVDAIRGALEALGIIFVAGNGEGPGVRLKMRPFWLAPKNITDKEWDLSLVKEGVWILATTEDEARRKVHVLTLVADLKEKHLTRPPWLFKELTSCEEKSCPFDLKPGRLLNREGGTMMLDDPDESGDE